MLRTEDFTNFQSSLSTVGRNNHTERSRRKMCENFIQNFVWEIQRERTAYKI